LVIGIVLGAASFALVSRIALSSLHDIVTAHLDDVTAQLQEPGNSSSNNVVLEALEASSPVFVRVLTSDGSVLAETAGTPSGLDLCTGDSSRVQEVTTITTPALGTLTLCAAASKDRVREAERDVLLVLLLIIPLAVAGVAIAVWIAVGRALRSVESLRTQAESMTSTSDGALDVEPTGDEIERLGETLNDLLMRLHAQSRSMRQFVADAGHELRNPLATLRVSLEFEQRAGEQPSLALVELDRLEALVQDLLILARTEAHESPTLQDVDLGRVLDEAVRAARQQHPEVTFQSSAGSCIVHGDERTLRGAVDNLLRNAARHCTSTVSITLSSTNGRALISVDDDGSGLDDADTSRVFDRFVRLDESRHRDEGGTGLGLAIVAATAQVHGGRVWALAGPGGRFRFEIPLR
jgi:signal transduction histidine kinase